MNSAIDFSIEIYKNETFLELKGNLSSKQIQTVRETLFSLVYGVGKTYFVDIERARFSSSEYLTMFLELLNAVKSKGADLVIIFHNDGNKAFFSQFFNVFQIYDSRDSYRKDVNFLKQLRRAGITYQKSTGLRLAPGIAAILAVMVAGWILTLFSIISSQDKDIREREKLLGDLENRYKQAEQLIENLQGSIAPLKGLGFEIDTSEKPPLGSVSKFTDYLDRLEEDRKQ